MIGWVVPFVDTFVARVGLAATPTSRSRVVNLAYARGAPTALARESIQKTPRSAHIFTFAIPTRGRYLAPGNCLGGQVSPVRDKARRSRAAISESSETGPFSPVEELEQANTGPGWNVEDRQLRRVLLSAGFACRSWADCVIMLESFVSDLKVCGEHRRLFGESWRRVPDSSEPGRSVIKRVAADHGFTHMGRFAAEYRQCFVETPSQALKGARLRLPESHDLARRGTWATDGTRISTSLLVGTRFV